MKCLNICLVYGIAGWSLNLLECLGGSGGVAAASRETERGVVGHMGRSLHSASTPLTSLRGHSSNVARVGSSLEDTDSTSSIWIAALAQNVQEMTDSMLDFLIELNCKHGVPAHVIIGHSNQNKNEDGGKSWLLHERRRQLANQEGPSLGNDADRDDDVSHCASLIIDEEPKNLRDQYPNRVERIAHLRDHQRDAIRNQMIQQVTQDAEGDMDHQGDLNKTMIVVVDGDLYSLPRASQVMKLIKEMTETKVAHTLSSRDEDTEASNNHLEPANVDAICAAGINHEDFSYYDTFATILEPNDWAYPIEFRYKGSLSETGDIPKYADQRRVREMQGHQDGGLVPVRSCFGGLTIYRASVWLPGYVNMEDDPEVDWCSYSLIHPNDWRYANRDDKRPCEHVVFHECLHRRNMLSIAIDPTLITEYHDTATSMEILNQDAVPSPLRKLMHYGNVTTPYYPTSSPTLLSYYQTSSNDENVRTPNSTSTSTIWNQHYQTPSHVPTPVPSTYPTHSPACLFELYLRTDTFGYETNWELLNETNGTVIAHNYDDTYSSGTDYKFEQCLTEQGTYRFTIFDSFGDGMIYGGSYEVRLGGSVLMAGGSHGVFYNETIVFTYEPKTASPPTSQAPSPSPSNSHAPSMSMAPTRGMINGDGVSLVCMETYMELQGSHHPMHYGNVTQARSSFVMDFMYQCNYGQNQDRCVISMNITDASLTSTAPHGYDEDWQPVDHLDSMNEHSNHSYYNDVYIREPHLQTTKSYEHHNNNSNSSLPSSLPALEVQMAIDFSLSSEASSWTFKEFAKTCYMNGGHLCSASMSFDVETNLTRNPAYGIPPYYHEYYPDPNHVSPKSMYTHFIPIRFKGNVSDFPLCTVSASTTDFEGVCSENDTASLASMTWSTIDLKTIYEQFVRYNYYDLLRNDMGYNGQHYYPHRLRDLWAYDYVSGVSSQLYLEDDINCYSNIADILSDVSSDEVCLIDTHALVSRDDKLHEASEAYFDVVQYDCSDPVSSKACNPYAGAWDDPLTQLNVTQNIYLNFTARSPYSSYEFDYAMDRFKVACQNLGFRPGFVYGMDINQSGTPDLAFHIERMPICLPTTCSEELALAEAIPEWLTCVMYGGFDNTAGNERCTRSFSDGVSFNTTATYVKDEDTCRNDIERMSSNLELVASWNGLIVQALTQCKDSHYYGYYHHGGTYGPICRVENTTDVDSVELDYTVDFTQFDDVQEYRDFEAACFETETFENGISDTSPLFCEASVSIISNFREYSTNVQINGLVKGFPLCYAPSCQSSIDSNNKTTDVVDEIVLSEMTLTSLMEHFFFSDASSSNLNANNGTRRHLSKYSHPLSCFTDGRGLQYSESEVPPVEEPEYDDESGYEEWPASSPTGGAYYESENEEWPSPSPTGGAYYPSYYPTHGGYYYNHGGVEFTILHLDCRNNVTGESVSPSLSGSLSPSESPTGDSLFLPEVKPHDNDVTMAPSESPSSSKSKKKGKSTKGKKKGKGKRI